MFANGVKEFMSQKIKHSKIKNTGLLYEILTRQVTADILDGRESKSVNLLKKYFNENTALGKEKELYDILLTNSYKDERRAEKLLEAVTKTRQRISNQDLKKEKYNLIKEISEIFSAKDFFNTRVSNYKTLASKDSSFFLDKGMKLIEIQINSDSHQLENKAIERRIKKELV